MGSSSRAEVDLTGLSDEEVKQERSQTPDFMSGLQWATPSPPLLTSSSLLTTSASASTIFAHSNVPKREKECRQPVMGKRQAASPEPPSALPRKKVRSDFAARSRPESGPQEAYQLAGSGASYRPEDKKVSIPDWSNGFGHNVSPTTISGKRRGPFAVESSDEEDIVNPQQLMIGTVAFTPSQTSKEPRTSALQPGLVPRKRAISEPNRGDYRYSFRQSSAAISTAVGVDRRRDEQSGPPAVAGNSPQSSPISNRTRNARYRANSTDSLGSSARASTDFRSVDRDAGSTQARLTWSSPSSANTEHRILTARKASTPVKTPVKSAWKKGMNKHPKKVFFLDQTGSGINGPNSASKKSTTSAGNDEIIERSLSAQASPSSAFGKGLKVVQLVKPFQAASPTELKAQRTQQLLPSKRSRSSAAADREESSSSSPEARYSRGLKASKEKTKPVSAAVQAYLDKCAAAASQPPSTAAASASRFQAPIAQMAHTASSLATFEDNDDAAQPLDDNAIELYDLHSPDPEPDSDRHPFHCYTCGKGYDSRNGLKHHYNTTQGCSSEPRPDVDANKPYQCPACGKGYDSGNGLRYHKRNLCQFKAEMSERNSPEAPSAAVVAFLARTGQALPEKPTVEVAREPVDPAINKPYQCDICKKRWKNIHGFQYHKEHSVTCYPDIATGDEATDLPYQCGVCKERWRNKNGLQYHLSDPARCKGDTMISNLQSTTSGSSIHKATMERGSSTTHPLKGTSGGVPAQSSQAPKQHSTPTSRHEPRVSPPKSKGLFATTLAEVTTTQRSDPSLECQRSEQKLPVLRLRDGVSGMPPAKEASSAGPSNGTSARQNADIIKGSSQNPRAHQQSIASTVQEGFRSSVQVNRAHPIEVGAATPDQHAKNEPRQQDDKAVAATLPPKADVQPGPEASLPTTQDLGKQIYECRDIADMSWRRITMKLGREQNQWLTEDVLKRHYEAYKSTLTRTDTQSTAEDMNWQNVSSNGTISVPAFSGLSGLPMKLDFTSSWSLGGTNLLNATPQLPEISYARRAEPQPHGHSAGDVAQSKETGPVPNPARTDNGIAPAHRGSQAPPTTTTTPSERASRAGQRTVSENLVAQLNLGRASATQSTVPTSLPSPDTRRTGRGNTADHAHATPLNYPEATEANEAPTVDRPTTGGKTIDARWYEAVLADMRNRSDADDLPMPDVTGDVNRAVFSDHIRAAPSGHPFASTSTAHQASKVPPPSPPSPGEPYYEYRVRRRAWLSSEDEEHVPWVSLPTILLTLEEANRLASKEILRNPDGSLITHITEFHKVTDKAGLDEYMLVTRAPTSTSASNSTSPSPSASSSSSDDDDDDEEEATKAEEQTHQLSVTRSLIQPPPSRPPPTPTSTTKGWLPKTAYDVWKTVSFRPDPSSTTSSKLQPSHLISTLPLSGNIYTLLPAANRAAAEAVINLKVAEGSKKIDDVVRRAKLWREMEGVLEGLERKGDGFVEEWADETEEDEEGMGGKGRSVVKVEVRERVVKGARNL